MDVLIDAPEMNKVYHTDALTLLAALSDKSVDAYITDLPYATTALSWDEIIPFAPMWAEVKRTLKPRGVFVTTASQPFTSKLVMSNLGMFRYEWVWVKNKGSNFASSRYVPFKDHENILCFYDKAPTYNPQLEKRTASGETRNRYKFNEAAVNPITGLKRNQLKKHNELRLPSSVQKFNCEMGLHPTQKPVDLYEYLIRTYTQAGELVVDFCCGSGTTAIAARNTGRRFIAGDITPEYVDIARKRLAQPFTPLMPMFI